jgi:CheY-like chemotaxis protein
MTELYSIYQRSLGETGANVVSARNGREGLEAIKNNHPNMVLSDIKMPEMDGFGLMREIRALGLDAGGSVPVVAMSACLIQGERASILDAGFQACLPKPFTPDKLMETLLAVLNDLADSISLDYSSPADSK